MASFLPIKRIELRRDAVKEKEAQYSLFSKIAIVICFILIFTTSGLATETARNSSESEKNTGNAKLDFSLELTPGISSAIGQLDLSQMAAYGSEPFESQPFVLTEVASSAIQAQPLQTPRQISKFQNSLYTSSLITLTALNVADYITTIQALKHEELEEANPAMKPIAKNIYLFAAVKLGVAALDIYILKKLYNKNKPLAWVLSVAANFAMSYIVANNVRMINRIQ
jgi:hypothetical protein